MADRLLHPPSLLPCPVCGADGYSFCRDGDRPLAVEDSHIRREPTREVGA